MSNTRQQVLDALKDADAPRSVGELAHEIGVHLNTVRFHLDALIATGQVEKAEPARGVPGRPAQRYHAIRRMDPGGQREFKMLAGLLVHSLAGTPDGPRRALDAGEAAGRELAATVGEPAEVRTELISFLDGIGFRSELDGDEVLVHSCPFLELAEQDPAIVCQAHLGLMRGAIARWDSGARVTGLIPFAEPDLCTAHLQLAGKGG